MKDESPTQPYSKPFMYFFHLLAYSPGPLFPAAVQVFQTSRKLCCTGNGCLVDLWWLTPSASCRDLTFTMLPDWFKRFLSSALLNEQENCIHFPPRYSSSTCFLPHCSLGLLWILLESPPTISGPHCLSPTQRQRSLRPFLIDRIWHCPLPGRLFPGQYMAAAFVEK